MTNWILEMSTKSRLKLNRSKVVLFGSALVFVSFIVLMTSYQSSPISDLSETTIVNGQPPYKASYHTDTSSSNTVIDVIRTGDDHQRVLSNSQTGNPGATGEVGGRTETEIEHRENDSSQSGNGAGEIVHRENDNIQSGKDDELKQPRENAENQSGKDDELNHRENVNGDSQSGKGDELNPREISNTQSGNAGGSKQSDDVGDEATRTEEHRAGDTQLASDQGTSPGDANGAIKTPDDENEEELLSAANAAVAEPDYTISFRRGGGANFSSIFAYDDRGNRQLIDDKWTQMPGATKELVLSAPELFDKIPLHYLKTFKNPCWLRGETELNCLPYFYIIGMYKCGTTDIYDKIVAHPDVVDVPKEPHWWGPRRHGFIKTPINEKEVLRSRKITGQRDDRSLEFYLNLYKFTGMQKLIDGKITDESGRIYHPKVFGDASISTAYSLGLEWTQRYPNASEPLFTNADLLRALQPGAKIVLMIRNPTERATSWYWYSHKATSAQKWDKMAKEYINCFKKCLKSHNLRYCAYASGCPYELIPDLQAGIYHVFLRDWINAYSRDRVHVIRLEDWKADPAQIYRELLKFLDLRPLTAQEEDHVLGRGIKNVYKHKHEDELPQTVRALREFYQPYNEELAKLLGGDEYLYT